MKRPLLLVTAITALLTVGTVSSLIAYRAGQRYSLGLQKGTLVGTVDALEQLRSGNIEAGTRRIESLCFMSGVVLLADDHYKSDSTVRMFAPTLTAYRQSYRTNRADWTPMEARLESLLAETR